MNKQDNEIHGYTVALLRSLHFSGVKFLRYFTIDVCGNVRCKVKPIDQLLLQHGNNNISLKDQVSVAVVCYAGLPFYADHMIPGTGMTAQNVLKLQPDLSTFRILPYAPKTAMVICNLQDQYLKEYEPSEFCTRGLLAKVLTEAKEASNIAFSVGVELEFCLVDAKTKVAVDESVFANSITLNEQEPFIDELYTQLQAQYITVELLHSESASGQLELVLKYSLNAMEMADSVLFAKETIRMVAQKHGMKALFAPKFNMMQAGSGMHIHMSVRDATTNEPIFCHGNQLTETGGAFVEGILIHLEALMGLSLPTVNSFRRIGPGCWTGSVVGWACEDKESGIRVCSNLSTQEWDHVEYKFCDSTCNLYLALAGILYCGWKGIQNKLPLREPMGNNETTTTPSSSLPLSVKEALNHLEKDEVLVNMIGPKLSQAYLALRRDEAERSSKMELEDEVNEFLDRA